MAKSLSEVGRGLSFPTATEPSVLRVRCTGRDTEHIKNLVDFQDAFKVLAPENYLKLKNEILTVGFCEPITVWKHQGKSHVLNGHQRLKVIQGMVSTGELKVPNDALPVNVVEADSVQEAKRMTMGLTSQYGGVQYKGYKKMLKAAGLTEEQGEQFFLFPDLVADPEEGDDKDNVSFEAKKKFECPKCGHKAPRADFKPVEKGKDKKKDKDED